MLYAMWLGFLRFRDRSRLLELMTYPGALPFFRPPWLDMQPPQLVRQEVDDMSAKTVFQEKLDPVHGLRLGMVCDKLVPMQVRMRKFLLAPVIHGRLL